MPMSSMRVCGDDHCGCERELGGERERQRKDDERVPRRTGERQRPRTRDIELRNAGDGDADERHHDDEAGVDRKHRGERPVQSDVPCV